MAALIVSAIISVFLAYKAYLAFDYRKVRFARYFILVLLCMAEWSFFFAGELGFVDAGWKFFSTCLSYPGNAFISTVWFLFAAEYCGVALGFIRRFEKAFFVFPALTLLAISTNPFHWLYYSSYFLDTSGSFPIIIYDHGPLFWIFFAYSSFLFYLGVFFFVRKFFSFNSAPRPQVDIVVGALMPFTGTLLYLGDVGPFALIDPSPFSFTLTGLIIFRSLMRNEFRNLVPIARENVIETMKDGYILLDANGNIADINSAALELAWKSRKDVLGRSLRELFEEHTDFFSEEGLEETSSKKISIKRGSDTRFFKLNISAVDFGGSAEGKLILIHDVTESYRYGEALKQANRKINLMSNITRHDILNQVNVLSGYTELLSEMLPQEIKASPRGEKYLKNLNKGIETIHHQILFTRDYQDLGVVSPVWQSVSSTALEAAFAFSNSEIEFSIEESNLEIYADPLLKKAFYNLFDNARSHGETVSKIAVSCREAGDMIIIEIQDNGIGVPADMKEHIFEKSVGKNTGLGLFLVKSILSITGLDIKETGIEGEGARFEIFVPVGNYRESTSQPKPSIKALN